jgi:hypothetical protein
LPDNIQRDVNIRVGPLTRNVKDFALFGTVEILDVIFVVHVDVPFFTCQSPIVFLNVAII